MLASRIAADSTFQKQLEALSEVVSDTINKFSFFDSQQIIKYD